MVRFIDLVESVTSLSLEEMQDMHHILQKSIAETTRKQILQIQSESKSLYKEGKLRFYDNSSDFLNALNEE